MIYKRRPPAASTEDSGGYALLLAVVITSAVLSAASALSSIVVSEIRQTREITNAIVAYAEAEVAVERALFLLRNTDLALTEIANLQLTIEPETRPQYFEILKNDFVSLSITSAAITPPLTSRIVQWDMEEPAAGSSTPCPSWIEVTTIGWDNDSSASEPFDIERRPYSRVTDFDAQLGLEIPFAATGTPVEMRIRALNCDIVRLGIEGIPGRIRLRATSTEGNVEQVVETLATRQTPASGLLDFVIFSECSIIKGEEATPDCPPR